MTEPLAEPTVVQLLALVMADVQKVSKADENTQQNYKFRGIDAVLNAVGPILRKHKVVVIPHKVKSQYRDVMTSTGKPSRECTVKVTYRVYGPGGDFVKVRVPGESMDFGDKGAPKAMSVAFRIALLQMLAIPTGDPEVDSVSYSRGRQQPNYSTQDEPTTRDNVQQVIMTILEDIRRRRNLTSEQNNETVRDWLVRTFGYDQATIWDEKTQLVLWGKLKDIHLAQTKHNLEQILANIVAQDALS